MGLCIKRRVGEKVFIGGNVTVQVVDISGGAAGLHITAPKDVPIHRDDMRVKQIPGDHEWHENHDNLLELSRHLLDTGELGTGEEVVAFFEKPWKWTPEWEEYEAAAAASEANRE